MERARLRVLFSRIRLDHRAEFCGGINWPRQLFDAQQPFVMASQPTEISNPSGNTPNSNNQNPNNQITNQNVRPAPSLSEGAIAGVAIGCAFVGAVIGAAILFLLFRRRQARQPVIYHQQHLPYNHAHRSAEKGPSVVTGAVANNVDNLIPQPVEDDAITKELSRIRDNIKNHVRTYYRFDASGAEGIQESQLVELATATGLRTSALLSSLADGSKRGDAISLFIAWVLMSRCEGNHHPSFLPADIAALAVAVPGKDVRNSGKVKIVAPKCQVANIFSSCYIV